MILRRVFIFFSLYLLFSGLVFAEEINQQLRIKQRTEQKPCFIEVSNPHINTICYVNQPCPITWDTSNIKSYGSVFLSIMQVNQDFSGYFEGGGYPVSNTGNYQWNVPANIGPLNKTPYCVKIVTPDHKCAGKSAAFAIKMKMNNLRMRSK